MGWKKWVGIIGGIFIAVGLYIFPFGQDLLFFWVKDFFKYNDIETWWAIYVISGALIVSGVVMLIIAGVKHLKGRRK